MAQNEPTPEREASGLEQFKNLIEEFIPELQEHGQYLESCEDRKREHLAQVIQLEPEYESLYSKATGGISDVDPRLHFKGIYDARDWQTYRYDDVQAILAAEESKYKKFEKIMLNQRNVKILHEYVSAVQSYQSALVNANWYLVSQTDLRKTVEKFGKIIQTSSQKMGEFRQVFKEEIVQNPKIVKFLLLCGMGDKQLKYGLTKA